ncbi:MAG: DUF4199 family protein [Putridiphycobacter sp.]|nr:DUF4199 family protein [Putridiphycobacter sp.]
MKIPLRVAMVCFLISVGITLGFYFAGETVFAAQIGGLWNMFLLLSAIGVGIYFTKRSQGFDNTTSFGEDFKVAVQGGVVFVVLLSLFTYVFHEKIDNSFIELKMNERLDANLKNVPNEAAYLELQSEDPIWKGKSYLDYIENQEDQAAVGLSAYSLAIGHLGIGLFLALFFSVVTTFIWRKIVMMDAR